MWPFTKSTPYSPPGELTACPSCGSTKLEQLYANTRTQPKPKSAGFVTGCHHCGLVFANPRPSEEYLERIYAVDGGWNSRFERSQRDHRTVDKDPSQKSNAESSKSSDDSDRSKRAPSEDVPKSSLHALSRHFDLSEEGGTGRKVLDFGCGEGRLLDKFLKVGWDTYGLDPATPDDSVPHTMLDGIPDEQTFDLVIVKHTFEHLPEPLPVMRALAKCLKPGGWFYAASPRLDNLPQHRELAYITNFSKHISTFYPRTMERHMELAGLKPVASYDGTADRPQRFKTIGKRDPSLDNNPPKPKKNLLDPAREAFIWQMKQDDAELGLAFERDIRVRAAELQKRLEIETKAKVAEHNRKRREAKEAAAANGE